MEQAKQPCHPYNWVALLKAHLTLTFLLANGSKDKKKDKKGLYPL